MACRWETTASKTESRHARGLAQKSITNNNVWVASNVKLALLTLTFILNGCASFAPDDQVPHDRADRFNRNMYQFNEDLDVSVLEPVSSGYTRTLPQPVRTGISNFFDNITYLDTTLNSFLQGKVLQGISDLGRIIINSSLGIGGILDVATAVGLEEHDEDFGQTLAVWGAESGDYLIYPLLGPSSTRDTGGNIMSLLTNPIFYAAAPVSIPLGILQIVDLRARNEGFVRFRDQAALDSYLFTRESYLQHRAYEIHDGKPPPRRYFEELESSLPPGELQQLSETSQAWMPTNP